jgi:Spy/CpxP family protein refolding chaperone
MRVSRWLMVALFVTSAVLVVEAQQPRRGGGGGGGQLNVNTLVLSNKDLQEELKVTDAQKEKFKESSEKLAELNKKRGTAFKDAGGDKDKLKEAFAELTKESEKVNEEIKKVVMDTLSPDQMKRLKQIGYQAKGIRAFSDEEIAKELKITEAQSSKIKGIMEEYAKDSKELGGGFGGGGKGGGGKGFDKEKFAENQKKREKLTKAAMADIDDALTDDQKKQWKEMTGAPFDTTKLRGGFGGGFGGNRNKNKTKD